MLFRSHFTIVTIPGSQRKGICTAAMLGYWQAMMILFEQELLGSHGFSLIPFDGLHAIFSTPSVASSYQVCGGIC